MRKLLKKLHLWLSLPAGIVIFTTCLSGALLVFQREILETAYPEKYFVSYEDGTLPMTLQELVPLVNAQLEDNSVAAVQVTSDPGRTYAMTLENGFRVSAFVNPYTGEITGYHRTQESAFFTIMSIHRWLMDGTRTWGKYAVGIATLLFIIILLTGLFIQPMSLFRRKTYRILKGRAMLYSLHNVLGIYACLVLLIGAATGLMWSFEWYRNGVFRLFGTEAPARNHGGGRGGDERGEREKPAVNYAAWDKAIDELAAGNPGFRSLTVQNGRVALKDRSHPNSRATDAYEFDRRTGEITGFTPYKDSEKSTKVWGWVYSLHTGDHWGWWSKVLVFFAALIGASLPVTGYWLYFRKGARKKNRSKKNLSRL